jgi:hypothetical protein
MVSFISSEYSLNYSSTGSVTEGNSTPGAFGLIEFNQLIVQIQELTKNFMNEREEKEILKITVSNLEKELAKYKTDLNQALVRCLNLEKELSNGIRNENAKSQTPAMPTLTRNQSMPNMKSLPSSFNLAVNQSSNNSISSASSTSSGSLFTAATANQRNENITSPSSGIKILEKPAPLALNLLTPASLSTNPFGANKATSPSGLINFSPPAKTFNEQVNTTTENKSQNAASAFSPTANVTPYVVFPAKVMNNNNRASLRFNALAQDNKTVKSDLDTKLEEIKQQSGSNGSEKSTNSSDSSVSTMSSMSMSSLNKCIYIIILLFMCYVLFKL